MNVRVPWVAVTTMVSYSSSTMSLSTSTVVATEVLPASRVSVSDDTVKSVPFVAVPPKVSVTVWSSANATPLALTAFSVAVSPSSTFGGSKTSDSTGRAWFSAIVTVVVELRSAVTFPSTSTIATDPGRLRSRCTLNSNVSSPSQRPAWLLLIVTLRVLSATQRPFSIWKAVAANVTKTLRGS